MTTRINEDAWRKFQEELAAIDKKPAGPLSADDLAKLTPEQRLALAKTEFIDLRKKHRLKLDDVLAFFPEDEVIQFIQTLIR